MSRDGADAREGGRALTRRAGCATRSCGTDCGLSMNCISGPPSTTHLLHTSTQKYTHFSLWFAVLCADLQTRPDFVRRDLDVGFVAECRLSSVHGMQEVIASSLTEISEISSHPCFGREKAARGRAVVAELIERHAGSVDRSRSPLTYTACGPLSLVEGPTNLVRAGILATHGAG